MGFLQGYSEPSAIDDREPNEPQPTREELLRALDTLEARNARQAEIIVQQAQEIRLLKNALRLSRPRRQRHAAIQSPF